MVCFRSILCFFFFFFNDTATTEIYTLSLHDALPISPSRQRHQFGLSLAASLPTTANFFASSGLLNVNSVRLNVQSTKRGRSEEHTSELQSPCNLVCRLLLEKKKKNNNNSIQAYSLHN